MPAAYPLTHRLKDALEVLAGMRRPDDPQRAVRKAEFDQLRADHAALSARVLALEKAVAALVP